jgi:hypothetical protein
MRDPGLDQLRETAHSKGMMAWISASHSATTLKRMALMITEERISPSVVRKPWICWPASPHQHAARDVFIGRRVLPNHEQPGRAVQTPTIIDRSPRQETPLGMCLIGLQGAGAKTVLMDGGGPGSHSIIDVPP